MKARDRNGKFTFKPGGVTLKGYPVIYDPLHPRAKSSGYVRKHILVAEKHLGRPLAKGEVIHHRNKNKLDCSPENLMVFRSHSEHMKYHWMLRNPKKYAGQPLPTALYVMEGIGETE